MNNTLTVVGNGTIHKAPDIMVLDTTLTHVEPTYKESMGALSAHYQALVDVLNSHGFNMRMIRTTSVDVHVLEKDDKNEKRVRSTQGVTVEAPIDLAKMSVLLDALRSHDDFNFSLSYRIADTDAATHEAVRLALRDAKALATVIAEETSVSLAYIESIRYGENSYRPAVMKMASDSYGMTPSDIAVSQQITVTWEIEEL